MCHNQLSEYDDLLTEATAKAEAFRATAREYIPKMYAALRNENPNISPGDARDRIQKDCINIWSRRTILDALPDEAKDPEKQKSGRLGQKKHKSAAFSAAQKEQPQKEISVVAEGSTIVEEVASSCDDDHDNDDKSANLNQSIGQLTVRADMDLSYSALLNENKQLRKQVSCLLEERTRDTNELNDLRAALAKTSFTSADQSPKTKLKHIVLDLQKFGADLIAIIQNGKSTCVVHMDDIGNVIDIKDSDSISSKVKGTIPS
jgi:regulator of replication initiation timing